MKKFVTQFSGLVLALACVGSAHAQVAYTNTALNGCYATRSTSLDNATATSFEAVGTLCFDGNGHIVAASHAPFLSGSTVNSNGTVREHNNVTGTYNVTNAPGDGMGRIMQACHIRAFVLHNVENGLAKGFSFMLVKNRPHCNTDGTEPAGGSAVYQGPLH
jgi:hypothetical protein